jgi:excinuclease UvrABC nuclease subunit
MEFSVKNKNSIVDLSRKIGYAIIDTNDRGEYNMVRRLQFGNYPRFHVYLKLQNDNYIFSLHLDQKKPIYGARGTHAHNGEYFGPVVETEADRIKEILQ